MSDIEALTQLTADITANFVANNPVTVEEIGDVIKAVYDALAKAEAPVAETPEPQELVGAVTIRRSLADPAKIISMIDGKPYSTLKRHLTRHGLTAEAYRARYKLPATYPMTAPAYSEARKAMAVKLGLGRKASVPVETPLKPVAPDELVKPRRKLGIATDTVNSAPTAGTPKPRRSSGRSASARAPAEAE